MRNKGDLKIRRIVSELYRIARIIESQNLPPGIKELKGGMTVKHVKKWFPWILKAKIKDAIIGVRSKKADPWEPHHKIIPLHLSFNVVLRNLGKGNLAGGRLD